MNHAAIRSLPERKTFTVAETAAIVGVGRSTLYEHVKRGDIPCIRVGRRVVIPREVVEAALAGRNGDSIGWAIRAI